MKRKLIFLLACVYMLAAGAVIILSLNTVYQYHHERTTMSQEYSGVVVP
ncbi:MAG: hypothetical protein P1P82_02220 [Bacteroidales bacterium]|nr:hypothetical protein [Bacteroidales bacterium]MDT8433020.1 hypothetical protein [Bacteroidales bacterium]